MAETWRVQSGEMDETVEADDMLGAIAAAVGLTGATFLGEITTVRSAGAKRGRANYFATVPTLNRLGLYKETADAE